MVHVMPPDMLYVGKQDARSGLGYGKPVSIEAWVVYEAYPCARIGGAWYVYQDGFVEITQSIHIEALNQWWNEQGV